MTKYLENLMSSIEYKKQSICAELRAVAKKAQDIEDQLRSDSPCLNELGEFQSLTTILDCRLAALSAMIKFAKDLGSDDTDQEN